VKRPNDFQSEPKNQKRSFLNPKSKLNKHMKSTKSYTILPVGGGVAWGAGIALAAIIAVSGGKAFAGPFIAGDLLVERLGNGTETLATSGNTIFFDEYTTAASQLAPVETVTIPDGNSYPGGNPMIEEGTGATIGGMTLSPDGLILSFSGYATNQPYSSSLTSTTSLTVPRAIGTLNGMGVYRLAASNTSAFSTYVIRGATTDDEGDYWAVASGGGGLWYFGTASPSADITASGDNLRGIRIFNNQLWFSTASSTPGVGIWAFSGLPTTATTPGKVITFSSSDSCYNFAVSPVGTVLYQADDGGYSATNSGIWKWTNNAGTWVRAYNLLNNGTTGTACFGLTVNWKTAGGATLYATTTNASANQLISVQDTGSANQTPTVLATAGTKEYFRGVAFVPTNTFTQGDLVVERLGDGTETLSTKGNTIFIDEFQTNGAGQSPVFTVTIPDGTGYAGYPGTGSPMVEEGTGGTTGGMTLSPDGQSLAFPGYATNQSYAAGALASANSVTVPRAIGSLNGSGLYTQAATSTSAFSTYVIRGATTDDEGDYWALANGGGGLWYFGTASPAADITATSDNLRGIRIFNSQLWFSTASSTPGTGIWSFPGLPTTATAPAKVITFANNDSCYNFAVNPAFSDTPFGSVAAGTVIYDADDGGYSATFAGIWKWTNNAGAWVRAYNVLGNGVTGTACFGLTVNWTAAGGPVLYATTPAATANQLITVQDTGSSNQTATVLATAPANTFFRGVAFAPTNAAAATPPSIVSITPGTNTANAGSTADIAVEATGTAPLSYYWYQGAVTAADLIAGATASTLTLSNVLAANAGSYQVVVSNSSGITATSTVATLTVTDPAFVAEPSSAEGLVGGPVTFAATAAGTGMTCQWWYSDAGSDLLAAVANGTLTSGSVISGASSGSAVTGNVSPALTITNLQTADFPILPTNFVLVVTGADGAVTSSVVTLYSIGTQGTGSGEGAGAQIDGQGPGYGAMLAFWNFNGPSFNNATPPPWFGVGAASLVNLPPYTTTVEDPYDGAYSRFPYGIDVPPLTNNSWGTSGYPATNANVALESNKLCGIQFMVSTLGAKNIVVSYDARVSPTASDYERLQFTTNNGADWIDYPSSSTFGGRAGTGNSGFMPFYYSLAGFSNVDNNPEFGIRVVSEIQSTATYGAGVAGVVTSDYVGTANSYGTGGTMTFDIAGFYGDAINPATYSPPAITGVTNQTNLDSALITNNFTVSGLYPPFTLSAVSLHPSTVSPSFAITPDGGGDEFTTDFTMVITPNPIPDVFDAAPILVTATDANGNTAVTWFDLFLNTLYPAPTNTLTALGSTNVLANQSLAIPFTVGSATTAPAEGGSTLTNFACASDNNTLVPSNNIVISNVGSINPTVIITPAIGQVGMAQISVTLTDGNTNLTKSTTGTFSLIVRPNTNVVFADYFDYDATQQSLDQIVGGAWTHLSGIDTQMKVNGNGNGDYVTVDSVNSTENLQAAFIGGPFADTGPGALYSSFIINLPGPALPAGNYAGFFLVFNDDSGTTGDYECGVYALTNDVVENDGNHYRLAIENWPGNGAEDDSRTPDIGVN
jgi:hypothetical protein